MLGSLLPFLTELSRSSSVDDAAVSDDCRFDERTDNLRWQVFADCLPQDDHARLNLGDWGEANKLHYEKRVKAISNSTPDAFLEINRSAWLEGLVPEQELVRIEDLTGVLEFWNTDFDALQALHEAPTNQGDAKQTLTQHFDNWNNGKRDNRPAFAAFLDEVRDEAGDTDWPHRLRDRLGLGHYPPKDNPKIPVALMRYSLQEALNAKASKRLPAACALPTVLDGGMHAYFFPVPREHAYGATLHLSDGKADQLAAEILHCRIDYQPKHLWKLGWIERPHDFDETAPDRDARLRRARDLHLMELRVACEREDFGEELVDRS
jgi:hypothetical protein